MPVPESAVFERLRGFAAIEPDGEHATRAITEVLTGRPPGDRAGRHGRRRDRGLMIARAAQSQWAARPVAERAAVLDRYRALVVANRNHLMDVIQAETGEARWAAQEEIMGLMFAARDDSRVASDLLAPHRVPGAFPVLNRAAVHARPKGVVGVIAP